MSLSVVDVYSAYVQKACYARHTLGKWQNGVVTTFLRLSSQPVEICSSFNRAFQASCKLVTFPSEINTLNRI